MKRRVRGLVASSVGAIAICFCSSAWAAESPAVGGVFFNPLGLAFGNYNLEVGFGLADQMSLNIGGSYFDFDLGVSSVTAYGGSVGVQYFPTGPLYQGWFLYPAVSFARSTATAGDLEASATAFGLIGLGGYQWDWRPFSLRLGAGLAFYSASADGDDIDVGFSGVSPALDASIGFTF